jgi:hypothetical protein
MSKLTREVTFNPEPETKLFEKSNASLTSDLQRLLDSYESILSSTMNSVVFEFVGDDKLSRPVFDDGNKARVLQYLHTKSGLQQKLSQVYADVYNEFWLGIFWPLLVNHGHQTLQSIIVDIFYDIMMEEGANATKVIDVTVVVLLKIAYPSFTYMCKNKCSSIDASDFPNAASKCKQILNKLQQMTVKSNKQILAMFENHTAFTFGCSVTGVKNAYQPI